MAQLTKAAFLSKWLTNFASTGARTITGIFMRDFRLDISDSFLTIEDNFVDEDDFVSDSATKVPSQQSVKAYVDAAVSGGTVASGTYTPTATAIANVASISTNTCQYMRVGSTVTVSGEVNVTPTSTAASTSLRLTLPIASALAQEHQCAGTANQELTGGVTIDGIIKGDTTNDEAILKFLNKTSTSSAPWFFTFTYTII